MLNIPIQFLPVAYFAVVAIPLIITDIREHRLPNKFTLPAIAITLGSWFALAVIENRWQNFWVAVGSAVIIFALGLGANRFGSLGMGDVKLATGLVLMLAWFVGLVAVVLPVIVAVVVVVHYFIGTRLGTLRVGSSLAVGPHIVASAVLIYAVGII